MVEINKTLDGTLEKAINASAKLEKMPGVLQDFMLLGDFKLGKAQRVKSSDLHISNTPTTDDPAVQNLAAQLAGLNKSQQSAVLKMTDLTDAAKTATRSLLDETAAGDKLSASVMQNKLQSLGLNEVNAKLALTNAGLIDSAGNYLVVTKDQILATGKSAEASLAAALSGKALTGAVTATNMSEQQLASSTIVATIAQQGQTKTTWLQIVATNALAGALAIAKQAAFALFIFGVSKFITYVKNLKTHTEKLVEAMNESHDAAEQAKKDVEEIQSKIDELNKSLKNAGVNKIEDIVDPAERERLQTVNDMLQAQLELKKQLEKDAANEANSDTSAVVNDKTEKSIKIKEVHDWTGDYVTSDSITKTDSLEEYTAAFEDTVQKRKNAQLELDKIAVSNGKDSKEYKKQKEELDGLNKTFDEQKAKVEELSKAVSEQMSGYDTNADNFAQYKDEYVAGTNAMTAATKALANANDDVEISTTAYDVLLQKMKTVKAAMDRRGETESKANPYTGAVKTLKTSGLKTGDDIRELSMVPANQTEEQAAAINVLQKAADNAHVTLDKFISALESVGLIAVRNTSKVKSLSDAMSTLDNMQSAYQSCAEAVKEYNKTGYVSMDTLQSLCQLEPQYLKMLELKNGKLKINTKTAQSLTQANIQLAKASLLADTLNNIKENNNLAKAKSILGDVTAVIKDADTALAAAAQKSQNEAKDSGGWEAYDYTSRANSVLIDNYHTLSELFDTLGKQDPSKIWGKDDKSTKQATSALDAWSTLSSAMEEYNKQGTISLNTMKSLMGLEEKYTACLKKQGNELTIDATKFRNMIQAELAVAAATEDASDKTKAKVAQYTQILQYLDENAKEGTISLNELRDAIEGVGASLDKAQEKTSGLKSAFGTIHDILNTDNPAGAFTSDNVESVIDLIQEHSELKNILYDENGSLLINEKSLKAATIALLENEKAATKDAAIQAILQKSIDDLSSGIISITDYLKGLNTELDDIDSKLDKFQSGFNDITDIVNEYNLYGKLNQDSLQKLLRLDPQYLECLEKEGNQLKFNAAQYRMLYAEQLNQLAITAKTQTQRDVYATALADIFGFTPDQLEQYKSAINEYSDTVQKFRDQGVDKYGNIDNLNRDIIEWTSENLEKYHDFVEEQNAINPGEIEEGGYSTVLGADENIDGIQIAFTPMLQTENGAVPLTEDQLWNYLDTIIEAAYGEGDTLDINKLLALDAEGLDENVNGVVLRVKGMIAAIQGMMLNGEQLTAADVSAIAG